MNKLKYLIINLETSECIIKTNYREIEGFISLIYPDKTICYSTVSNRFKNGNNYFKYYDLIIKKLLW
tara:strand:+ start:81 stop:281 length:201 start_codon:yes stop_codon:yes gene_type:complete